MKTSWRTWLLTLIIVPAPFVASVIIAKHYNKPKPAQIAPACFISGYIEDHDAKVDDGFAAATNAIRLNMAGNTLAMCKKEIEVYCRSQLQPHPNLTPYLHGYFRDATGEKPLILHGDTCMVEGL